jgi:hypothetical protein
MNSAFQFSALAVLTVAGALLARDTGSVPETKTPTPILVELFMSEGRSSSPPASWRARRPAEWHTWRTSAASSSGCYSNDGSKAGNRSLSNPRPARTASRGVDYRIAPAKGGRFRSGR